MIQLPYVIDNQAHRLADVLNALLADEQVHALDIATAYFNVGGYALLREALAGLRSVRLLLGHEPESGSDLGLRPRARPPLDALRGELDRSPFTEETQRLVEDLIRFLRRAYDAYRVSADVLALLEAVGHIVQSAAAPVEASSAQALHREDLHLVCWEYVWS